MKKNLIKKLALASYSDSNLDVEKANTIAKKLKKEELKVYIKNLKILEAKKTVTVTLPNEESLRDIKNQFIRIYPDKKILVEIDPTLITGIKVVDYDNEYELSLKSFLEGSISTTND